MDFNATIDLIIRELEEAREIVDDLKKIDGAPELEIELAKSKIRNAGEIIALLKQRKEEHTARKMEHTSIRDEEHVSFRPEERAAPRYEELKYVEAESPLEQKSDSPEPEPATRKSEPEKDVTKKGHDPVRKSEPGEAGLAGKKNIKEQGTPGIARDEEKDPGKPDVEKTDTKPFVAPIIADTFSHLANRFNEQIGERQVDDFSYTHGRHYTSLTDAIGLNDRFYFIRELFDGDRDAYNDMIGKLEKAADLPEAKEIIMSHRKGKHDNEAAKHLLDMVKRKFASHE